MEAERQMNDDRTKRDSMSIEGATTSNMWEIAAIVEMLERKGLCTKQDLYDIFISWSAGGGGEPCSTGGLFEDPDPYPCTRCLQNMEEFRSPSPQNSSCQDWQSVVPKTDDGRTYWL